MDWLSIKFDWNNARAFLATAEEGSLSAAARALGMVQPTLSRQVYALESELGVTLFERGGRGLTLTQNGLELVEHARAMGDAASRMSLTASGRAHSSEGRVCITAGEVYSAFILPPVIAKLRLAAPGLTIEIATTNDVRDLRRGEAVIAIRNSRPADPDLIATKIRDDTACLYAAEDYFAQCGEIRTPEDMARARFIGFDHNEPFIEGLNALGLKQTPKHFPVLSNSQVMYWELVKRGVGIGVMITQVGDAEPKVRRAAPWLEPFKFPIWLVAHREANTSRCVRPVFDLLTQELTSV